MPLAESMPPGDQDPLQKNQDLQDLLDRHGETELRNPHFGKPGHENDPEFLTVYQAQYSADYACPPLIDALLRVGSPEAQEKVIELYKKQ